jgi:hypothetical protein
MKFNNVAHTYTIKTDDGEFYRRWNPDDWLVCDAQGRDWQLVQDANHIKRLEQTFQEYLNADAQRRP